MAPQSVRSFYTVLEITPQASPRQIRDAYRELSKLYHPDTTLLAPEIARERWREVQDAYRILADPIHRAAYDLSLLPQYQAIPISFSARHDDGLPIERPLSGGELFAILTLAGTLIGCLSLAIIIALLRGNL